MFRCRFLTPAIGGTLCFTAAIFKPVRIMTVKLHQSCMSYLTIKFLQRFVASCNCTAGDHTKRPRDRLDGSGYNRTEGCSYAGCYASCGDTDCCGYDGRRYGADAGHDVDRGGCGGTTAVVTGQKEEHRHHYTGCSLTRGAGNFCGQRSETEAECRNGELGWWFRLVTSSTYPNRCCQR